MGDVQLETRQPMDHDGREGRCRGDHEWNFGDRIAAERIDALHCGTEAGWNTNIEHAVLGAFDCTLKGTRAHLRFPYASMAAPCKTFSHIS